VDLEEKKGESGVVWIVMFVLEDAFEEVNLIRFEEKCR